MSLKKIAKEQPENFQFDDKNIKSAKKIISNYPEGKQQSAVMPLLYLRHLYEPIEKNLSLLLCLSFKPP